MTWHPVGALNLGALHDPPANCGVEGRPGRPGLRLAEPWRSCVCRWLLAGLRAGVSRGAASFLVGCFPAALAKMTQRRAHRHGHLRFMSSVFFKLPFTQALETDGEAWPFLHTSRPGAEPRGRRGSLYTSLSAVCRQTPATWGEGSGWGLSRNPRAALCGRWLEISVPVAEAVTAVRQHVMGPWSPVEIRVTP